MDMGQKIKALREQKGMTLEELGNKVGVGKSTVRKWETGMIANMRRDKIAKIAKALDVEPSYLMGWDSPTEPTRNEIQYAKLSILTKVFEATDDIGQDMIVENAKLIMRVHPRKDEPLLNAAHERTDIKITDEMRKHDEDIMDDENF